MKEKLKISDKTWAVYQKVLPKVKTMFEKIDEINEYNTAKVLQAFWHHKVSEAHFASSSGYGYNDIGREVIENIYADIFECESALVRMQFVSGSHTLAKTFFALLRPNDLLLSISGRPYDTLHEVIGIKDNPSSLKSFGILYDEIDLVNDDFDYEKIKDYLHHHSVKVIEIQRSKGYSSRKSLSIEKIAKVIKLIKEINKDIIVMVDNCYCELVSKQEPTSVGADLVVGSLIKNLGGGIALNGGYVAGKKELIDLVGESLYLPGEKTLVGPTLGANKMFLQGLYNAPSVVASSLKIGVLTSAMLEELGYKVEPKWDEEKVDIVTNIWFLNPEDLIKYCEGIQSGSAIDSFVKIVPDDMPGYDDKIIMASGSFVQGSSIELSCDGPLRDPYLAYQQGGLNYEAGKIGVLKAIDKLLEVSDEETKNNL